MLYTETNVKSIISQLKKGRAPLHSEFQPVPVLCFLLCCIARILKKTILSFRNFTGGGGGKELFYFVILFCFWYLTGSCSGRDGLTK